MKNKGGKEENERRKNIKTGERNNTSGINDNDNSVINTCRSDIKSNITEKEGYLE